jgi:hypothetical protein
MKRICLISILLLTIIITLALAGKPSQALPEYSSQTGEPCASCHISPSGGGPRTLRGQAWVAAGKPGAVPNVVQSLELLGISLEVNESDYVNQSESVPPLTPLKKADQPHPLHNWLKDYEGN